MKKILIVLLLLTSFLYGDLNKKDILMKKARRLRFSGNYEKSLDIYNDLNKEFPNDYKILSAKIKILFLQSKIETAEKILNENRKIFPARQFTELKITIFLRRGETKAAYKIVDRFFENSTKNTVIYKSFSSLFYRNSDFEKALELLIKARKISKDDYLYSRDFAKIYNSLEKFDKAIEEYLKKLEQQKGYFNLVNNRIEKIIKNNPESLKRLEDLVEEKNKKILKKLLAKIYVNQNEIENAIEIYKKIDPNELISLSKRFIQTKEYEKARLTLKSYKEFTSDKFTNLQIDILVAQIDIQQKNFDSAKEILLKIYNELDSYSHKYRRVAGKNICDLLYETEMNLHNYEKSKQYLVQSKKYARNSMEKKEITFQIVYLETLLENFEEAKELLEKNIQNIPHDSKIFKNSIYFDLMIDANENHSISDSLLKEIVISEPENPILNDLLLYSNILKNFSEKEKESFWMAFRNKELTNDAESKKILVNFKNDFSLLLKKIWFNENPESIKMNSFIETFLNIDISNKEQVKNFLRKNPNHELASYYRLKLN